MTNTDTNKAVIYSRVATHTIAERSDGIEEQKRRCNEFAQAKGYSIAAAFSDIGSGDGMKRPGLTAMLKFLAKNRDEKCCVLIDEPTRLARSIEAQAQLLAKIRDGGARVEYASLSRLRETEKLRSADKSLEMEQER